MRANLKETYMNIKSRIAAKIATCKDRIELLNIKKGNLRQLHSLNRCRVFVQRKTVSLFI